MADTDKVSETKSLAKGLIIAIIIILVAAIILFLLTKSRTTTTKQYQSQAVASSLRCTGSDVQNEVFNTLDATPASYTIDAIFYDDKLDSITSTFYGIYADKDIRTQIEPYIHADFNEYFYDHDTNPDAMLASASFDILSEGLQVSATTSGDKITNVTLPVFMLNLSGDDKIPSTLDEYKAAYTNNSFVCTVKKNS